MLPTDFSLSGEFEPVRLETWRAAVEADLHGVPFEKRLVSRTYDGLAVPPLYVRQDWDATDDPSGMPGAAPFTRGRTALGHVVGGWDIRQEYAHPDPGAVHDAALADLAGGVSSLALRLDRAARHGLDPAAPDAVSRAGHDGAMLYDVEAFARALDGVHLTMAGVALDAGAATLPAAALLTALARGRGDAPADLRLAFNADPLAALARDGSLPVPLETTYRDMADLARWTSETLPGSTSVQVDTSPYHDAGATAAQDLGFSMATGVRYLRALTDAGLPVSVAARQIVFTYSVGCHFFFAIAKLRAARTLWARVVEACGGDEASAGMRLHVRPGRRVLTQRDPWVNLLRNTVCCFAGAAAGADAITAAPFDAAIGLPDAFSRRIARNTQVILHEESHLNRVIDPAGGSWMIESQTDALAEMGWAVLQEIEAQGGMDRALLSGGVRERVEAAAAARQRNIETRRDPITGVSEFPAVSETPVQREVPDHDALRAAAAERLRAAASSTVDLEGAGPVMERLVEAAAQGASLGALARALWQEAGEGPTIDPLVPRPYAEPFERLRDASDRYKERTGHRPAVFLVAVGPVAQHTARTTYAKSFFEAGGFEVRGGDGVDSDAQAVEAFRASGARIAVICSSDALYESVVPALAPQFRAAGATDVVLAGRPGEREAAYREAGVDRFIYVSCNVYQTLRELLIREGVLDHGS